VCVRARAYLLPASARSLKMVRLHMMYFCHLRAQSVTANAPLLHPMRGGAYLR